VDSSVPVGGTTQRPNRINLQEESESKQDGEPCGGDRSLTIDHSVVSGRRRVGFLLGFSLSRPLALPGQRNKTLNRLCVHTPLGTTSLRLFGVLV